MSTPATSLPSLSSCPSPDLGSPILSPHLNSFSLRRDDLLVNIPLPEHAYDQATDLASRFLRETKHSAPQGLGLSPAQLLVSFAAYVTRTATGMTQRPAIIQACLLTLEEKLLQGSDVHSLATTFKAPGEGERFLRDYYFSLGANPDAELIITGPPTALFRARAEGTAAIFAIFGGQGNTENILDGIRQLSETYGPLMQQFLTKAANHLLSLSNSPDATDVFEDSDIQLLQWLADPTTCPEPATLLSPGFSFPLIGLEQLLQYMVVCNALRVTPGSFNNNLKGAAGHSQGVVVAAFIAGADTWESFEELSLSALTVLFWIGVRSQQENDLLPKATPDMVSDAIANGEGTPSPMLNVRGLPLQRLEKEINAINKYLEPSQRLSISLINDTRNHVTVVGGPPRYLCSLSARLRRLKPAADKDQSKIPFSKRRPRFRHSFLPIGSPFHTPHLKEATDRILQDLNDQTLHGSRLRIPVYHTLTGEDISQMNVDIIPELVAMVTERVVNWELATQFDGATHIVDFGPGGASGVGPLTARQKDGAGVRVILAGCLQGPDTELGYLPEFVATNESQLRYATSWKRAFYPRLINVGGREMVHTRLSCLLGAPPIVVAGMTPTTVHPDFVAAVMKAGYHAELAGGGYHDAASMEKALLELASMAPKGRGITVNLIYANPRAISWQIDLLARLRDEGLPIEGLTIGAGVPSLEVARRYIDIGFRHISFKPGSPSAINSVIEIAQANPSSNIILQWTGGRGGGHHSYEDFHEPIIQAYGRIRQQSNIVLVAGSGFGCSEDTLPYITGDWSLRFNCPPMPFDGCLLGSRLMVAREAHTSPETKQVIIDTKGLSDSQWEKSYNALKMDTDIFTVISEMGEPIHMIGTRGVRLWAELDEMVFTKPAAQQKIVLRERKAEIIRRLYEDSHKPWFPKNSAGKLVDVDEMTYAEVLRRLTSLLYVKRSGNPQWIHPSHRTIFVDFLQRAEERFIVSQSTRKISLDDLSGPSEACELIVQEYPASKLQTLLPQDVSFFLQLCHRTGQKPVPFVPVLDENFATYFKKDSLWQSEDVEAVVDGDVGRVCILHGPVAAASSRREEAVGYILNEIHDGHLNALRQAVSPSETVQRVEYLEYNSGASWPDEYDDIATSSEGSSTLFQMSDELEGLPSDDQLHGVLGGVTPSWRKALFQSPFFAHGARRTPNFVTRMVKARPGQIIELASKDGFDCMEFYERGTADTERICSLRILYNRNNGMISINMTSHITPSKMPLDLVINLEYNPSTCGSVVISEVSEGHIDRVKAFYWQLWYGTEYPTAQVDTRGTFTSSVVKISPASLREFARVVRSWSLESRSVSSHDGSSAIMDYSFVVAWHAIMKPLFTIDADLLKLVHLGNEFRLAPGARPLAPGDEVSASAKVVAVINQESGKMVKVLATVLRDGVETMTIVSQFLYRGKYSDVDKTFELVNEEPMTVTLGRSRDIAVLQSRPWLVMSKDSDLLGKKFVLRAVTNITYQSDGTKATSCTGTVTESGQEVGKINYQGTGETNPVMSYLKRNGKTVKRVVPLKAPIPIGAQGQQYVLKAPRSNAPYSLHSGDLNPIHTSPVFAAYAGLPGSITHGMHTSAAVRSLVVAIVAQGDETRILEYSSSFVGMVRPGDELAVSLLHVAMHEGAKIIEIVALRQATGETVLKARAKASGPRSAFVFTGQGSQRKGMGMDLASKSAPAAEVWRRADAFFNEHYGFSISHIVREDPKQITINFGGRDGRRVLSNYLALLDAAAVSDRGDTVRASSLYRALRPTGQSRTPRSYTFTSTTGLLSSTQFTQPALTIMELARFEDLRHHGLIPLADDPSQQSTQHSHPFAFAGHSLGEYGALAALGGGIMTIETLAAITFARGLTMQMAVTRDANGKSGFSMCAVNPSKVSPCFTETELRIVVSLISKTTNTFLEIVNFNIQHQQYICAGEDHSLATLSLVLSSITTLSQNTPLSTILQEEYLSPTISSSFEKTSPKQPYPRTKATIPLPQIDVPFHSTYLASGVDTYRHFLRRVLSANDVRPEYLVGKWIPNVMGKKFGIGKRDFEDMVSVTGSGRLREIVEGWEE